MKLNIAYPAAGTQRQLDVTDEFKLRVFYDKRISHEVPGDSLGSEWKGYLLKITGGADICGTPMMQGVLTTGRASLLLGKGHVGCKVRSQGVRYRRSVRGCIVSPNLSVLNLVIVKKGAQEIAGLTDVIVPRRLGPKRADKIRRIFKLSPEDDVRKYVIRRRAVYKDEAKRKAAEEAKKPEMRKAPKIQRLVTLKTKRRTKILLKQKQRRSMLSKKAAEDYHKLIDDLRRKDRKQNDKHRRQDLSLPVTVSAEVPKYVKATKGSFKKTIQIQSKNGPLAQKTDFPSRKPTTFQAKKADKVPKKTELGAAQPKKSQSTVKKSTDVPPKKTGMTSKKAVVVAPKKKADSVSKEAVRSSKKEKSLQVTKVAAKTKTASVSSSKKLAFSGQPTSSSITMVGKKTSKK